MTDYDNTSAPGAAQVNALFPTGLIGRIASYIYGASHYPSPQIALAGAIGFLSGITGRAYNTYTGAGLNQYILVLAMTGMGKDAIAKCLTRLIGEVVKNEGVKGASSFKGPGELVSSAGLIKWIANNPAIYMVLGEFALKLAELTSDRANPHAQSLLRLLLQLYSKSDFGDILDPIAYSDTDKNTPPIHNPSVTVISEAAPEKFYELLNPGMIESGFLPRFLTFEQTGQRPYAVECPQKVPLANLVMELRSLCANCLAIPEGPVGVHTVPANSEARATFRDFERWTTDQINAASSEVSRQLWNRAHLKALKLATLCAVGNNQHNPIVTIENTMWATRLVVDQTQSLMTKFSNGEVGETAGNQTLQEREITNVIADYLTKPWTICQKYHGTKAMHSANVITQAHIAQRVYVRKAFAKDPRGPKDALTRTIKCLLEADIIREIPHAQMVKDFGKHPRAFAVSDPNAIIKEMKL